VIRNEVDRDMWAQLIEMKLKHGQDPSEMIRLIRAAEQPGSGLVRSQFMRDQADPERILTLVVFESEEKARAREQDPRRTEQLAAARSMMAAIFEGPPRFTDLEVVDEWTDATA
jgi:heme-degrading monooxygenase HmoA